MKKLLFLFLMFIFSRNAFSACQTGYLPGNEASITKKYTVCDTDAELPNSGLNEGDRLYAKDTKIFYIADSATTYFSAGSKSSAASQILLSTSPGVSSWTAIGDCDSPTNAVTYDVTTKAFGCNTISGSATWGTITGTLATQTDLVSELALKANLISPVLVTPALGVATATTINGLTITESGLESVMDLQDMQGAVTDAQVPDTITASNYQPLDSDLTTIAGLTATTDNFIVSNASAWASRTPAQAKTSLALVKGDVGLGSVDNTSDAGKPVSTAQQTALNLKADLASPTFSGTPSLPTGTTATTQSAGNNTTALATTAFVTAINNNSSYRTILQASGSHIAGRVAGTYGMGAGDPLAVSGTGTLYPLAVIQIASADYPTVNGITTKLRIRAQLYVNDVAPTGNFTFGLYPITRPATSGGAGLNIYTLGTVVSGSNGATFTAPAADLLGSAVGSDFALPADGPYVIGVITTATVAVSSHVHANAQLQIRNT